MKRIILLLSGLSLLCACNQKKMTTYEWDGILFNYDSAKYEMVDLDEDYGVNFTLVEKAHPDNRADYALSGDAVYLDMSYGQRSQDYKNEMYFFWHANCTGDPEFSTLKDVDSYLPCPLADDDALGRGTYLSYDALRGGKPVWGVVAADGKGINLGTMHAECDNKASADAFLEIFKQIVFPELEDDPAASMTEDEYYEDDFYEDYSWDCVELPDIMTLMYDTLDYTCTDVEYETDEDMSFKMYDPQNPENAATFHFWQEEEVLDMDDDEWAVPLQELLDPLMEALKKDKDFLLDGLFSPWDSDIAYNRTSIQYQGTRVRADKSVVGAFAAMGLDGSRATMHAECDDESTLEGFLHLFDQVDMSQDEDDEYF